MKTAIKRLAAWMPQVEILNLAAYEDSKADRETIEATVNSESDALNQALASASVAHLPQGDERDEEDCIDVQPQPAPVKQQEPTRKPRMTQEELDALRKDAVAAYEVKGYDLRKAEWDAGRPMDSWTKTDCKRLLRLAEQMPANTPPQPDDAPAPDAFTCPASGTRITAERCPSCQQRNGCPAWDTSDATA